MTGLTKKLEVNKDVKLALDSVADSSSWTKGEIIQKSIEKTWTTPLRKPLNEMKLDDLIQALYDGYVRKDIIMQTGSRPNQEKLDELVTSYNKHKMAQSYTYEDGISDGIQFALSKLNINIEGINL
ncbi:hypothetical protein [Priestia megaterium]|uniref:hypothetical protein n=1 Tax=Priestia megaterium TaxID=1404 RepID=UPI0028637FE1|nr:hypothetical protein [Priestia megaterium]MDR7207624.1 response regulator of citrate/malate metabolism [Priestia megaterium]